MLPLLLGFGAAMIMGSATESRVTPDDKPQKQVEFQFSRANTLTPVAGGGAAVPVEVRPYYEFKYQNINRQMYDFSCGSGALVTLINNYLGFNVTEQAAMEGMMAHGEKEKIVERRGFSMLDMKRYVLTLGAVAAGYRGTVADLAALRQPAIVSITYGGSKHFVVVRGIRDGKVFIADPSIGYIIFSEGEFDSWWADNKVMLILSLPADQGKPLLNLALSDRELGLVDTDLVKPQINMKALNNSLALEQAVKAQMGIQTLRRQ
ncbi:MAG: C39 family peptidase [Acidobacteriota bacterium]